MSGLPPLREAHIEIDTDLWYARQYGDREFLYPIHFTAMDELFERTYLRL
jgi:hypothetical protein